MPRKTTPQPFSAKTGKFVTKKYANAHPSTTVQPGRPKKK